MDRMRSAIVAAMLATAIRLIASLRRVAQERGGSAARERVGAAIPAALLESPALIALSTRMLRPEARPALGQRGPIRWLLLAIVVAVIASVSALAISVVVRRRRRARLADAVAEAVAPPVEPFVIPIEVPLKPGAVELPQVETSSEPEPAAGEVGQSAATILAAPEATAQPS